MEPGLDTIDSLCIDTIRTLSMDAVERAGSGHPGTPMALAPVAWLLFSRYLRHDPSAPDWPDRDRFVLSCGHASMLLYATLHLSGYGVSLDDIRDFRQWGSITPGHPERGVTPGVEITTGPLGQGCAASVGMALAEAHLAAELDGDGSVVDHRTWALVSDGDLMEGVAHEAASLAGHIGLGKLIWVWDDNRITIEGATDLAFSEDVVARFAALGWRTLRVEDVNDLEALAGALETTATGGERPTLLAVRSRIAWGAPNKQGSEASHGAPLGPEDVRGAKAAYGWPEDAEFYVPEAVEGRRERVVERGRRLRAEWERRWERWAEAHPRSASELTRRLNGTLPDGWDSDVPGFSTGDKTATRAASGKVLSVLAERVPELIGGSADLGPSCKTVIPGDHVGPGAVGGRNVHFGIREHGMAAVLNGLALHGGVRPFGSTFLVFSDYMRPAMRLAAMMRLPVVYVFTHDSVGVGEDGPTHQPVEHLAALRTIPGLTVVRPADGNEAAAAWCWTLAAAEGPVALVLTRQGVPVLEGTAERAGARLPSGGYVLREPGGDLGLVLVASGSEVALAMAAADELAARDVAARVVSLPSWELWCRRSASDREAVLPSGVPKLVIEAGRELGWREIVGEGADVLGLERFGASAPGPVVYEKMGFSVAAVVERAEQLLRENR